jgi:hypothetical protein
VTADERGRLQIAVEVDANRKLTPAEFKALREDLAGQISDGIGAGCFAFLTPTTGISVVAALPLKVHCAQAEGKAWKPSAATARENARRIAAIKKEIDARDAAADESPAVKSAKGAAKAPSLKKLLRLLSKVDRERLYEEVKAEVAATGNDLSNIADGELPSGNFRDPKFLRLLMSARLRPEVLDARGYTLLYQAAPSAGCIEVLLKHGVNVNRICHDFSKTTALIRAAWLGEIKSVETLLAAGADPSIRDEAGKIALDRVDPRSRNKKAIEELLRRAGRKK